MTSWKTITEYHSDDRSRKAVLNVDLKTCYYFIDFYENNLYTNTIAYPDKSIYFAQDAAENYCNGILNVSETA